MIDKNFIDILYKANGGKFGEEVYQRVKEGHNMSFEMCLQPYIDMMGERLSKSRYGDMMIYLDACYSVYAEEGYKAGFFDGMRFLADIIVNDN